MENQNNQTNQNCDHVWIGVGIWDGKTPNGKRTGGIMFQCTKCFDKAQSETEIKEKGGKIDWENSTIKAARGKGK